MASWESRFTPDVRCQIRVTPGVSSAGTHTGSVTVRVHAFDANEPLVYTLVSIAPLDSSLGRPRRVTSKDSLRFRSFDGLEPGRYELISGAISFSARHDTIEIRPGMSDTLDVGLELFLDGYRNVHNCRPRGFRRSFESACVTDSEHVEDAIDYARSLAKPEDRRLFHMPAGDTIPQPRIIRDERICEKAGRLYGGPESPPRRVVVVSVGKLFVVYDPFEPEAAGEFNIWMVFDEHWREVVRLAS